MTDQAVKQLEDRLKAVSSRLEAVEKQLASGGGHSGGSAAPSAPAASGGGSDSAWVGAYDNLISTYIDRYVELSSKLDPLVQQQAALVKQAVTAQRAFLSVASQSKKPADSALQSLLKPTSDKMAEISGIRDKNRAHKFFNWLSVLSEGISALGWVVISPTPGPAVDEARSSSEFYSNKILMQYKNNKDAEGELQREWVGAFNNFLKELRSYIKQYHTTGLSWNPRGGEASAASVSSGPPAPSGGGAPPPPSAGGPPPPAFGGPPPTDKEVKGTSADARAALFSEINKVKERQAGGRTEGLRKVQDHEKNKNKKISGVVTAGSEKAPAAGGARGTGAGPAKPPKLALEGNKWIVEFQKDNKGIVIEETEPKHTVYIYKCENSVVQVKGKVNAITLDGCKKTGVVFESAIASCEIVNCQSVQIQVTGKVPNFAVDKTDGCQLFISKESLAAEIVTSKISEMNIVLPPKNEGEDGTECPVSEQYLTVIKGNSLHTTPVSHLG